MAGRDFTEKDLEDIGWNLVDRMLALSRPQSAAGGQPDMGMRLQGLRQAALKWSTIGSPRVRRQPAVGGPIRQRRTGVPEMLGTPKI